MEELKNEFTQDDTPFPFREDAHKRVLVVGIGRCGVRILHCISETETTSWMDTLAIDTDASTLSACNAKWKINAFSDYSPTNANGCGGNVDIGRRAVAHERNNIEAKWREHDIVIVIGGLGGGTATGGMEPLASIAKAQKIPTVFLLLLPFAFEAYSRRKNANTCIDEFPQQSGVIVPIPADLLYSTLISIDTPISEAFERAAREIAAMIGGLASSLQACDLIGSTNYATIATALTHKKAMCGLGIGRANSQMGSDRTTFALGQLLDSPFLGGNEHLEKSNTVIVTLTAGPDLTFSEVKRTFELAKEQFPKNCELICGANILNSMKDTLQLTALTIRYEILPATKPHKKEKKQENPQTIEEPDLFSNLDGNDTEEPGLGLVMYSKGIFEGSQEYRYGDEDLDIPTYQRRSIRIDKGI